METTYTHLTENKILASRIKTIARGDEDLEQEMWLKLLEKSAAEPAFAAQRVGYHIGAARFHALNIRRSNGIYNRYVEDEPELTDADGEPLLFDEIISDPDSSVEEIVTRAEYLAAVDKALASLPKRQQQAFRLSLAGLTNGEIAARLGVTKGGASLLVSRSRENIKTTLAGYLL